VRQDELSNAPLQFRSVPARYYLVAVLSSRLSPVQTARVPRRLRLKRWAVPILLTRDPNVVRSAASVVVVVAAVWCLLRREEFRLGDAVETVQGGLLDAGVLADHVGGDAGVAQSQCQ
jgi:hypothetical protein